MLEGEDNTKYSMLETSQKVKELILKGDQPPLPQEILDSNDPAIQALVEARANAIAYKPEDRLSARSIANILDAAVSPEIRERKTLKNDNVDLAPFPQNDQGLHKLEFVHIGKLEFFDFVPDCCIFYANFSFSIALLFLP